MSRSACLSLQRARIGHRRSSDDFRAIQSFRLADPLARCQAGKSQWRCHLVAVAPRLKRQQARPHRADTCALLASVAHAAPSIRTVRRTAGRTRQLCNRSIPFHFNSAGCVSVPFVPTVTNCRDRQRQRCPKIPEAAMLRISAWWVQARLPIGPRDFVRPKTSAIGAGSVQLSFRLAA